MQNKLSLEIGITPNQEAIEKLSKKQIEEFNASKAKNNKGYCVVCYADFNDKSDPENISLNLECGHQFCTGCWKQYLIEKINQSALNCLNTRCQQKGCNMQVPYSVYVHVLEQDKDKSHLQRYNRFHC